MNKKDMISAALDKLGYQYETDSDGDFVINYQMKFIYVLCDNLEESFLSLSLLQFMPIGEGKEKQAIFVCDKLTREQKLVKVYIDYSYNSVSATCDFYFTDEESLLFNLKMSLQILGVVRSTYRKCMLALDD